MEIQTHGDSITQHDTGNRIQIPDIHEGVLSASYTTLGYVSI